MATDQIQRDQPSAIISGHLSSVCSTDQSFLYEKTKSYSTVGTLALNGDLLSHYHYLSVEGLSVYGWLYTVETTGDLICQHSISDYCCLRWGIIYQLSV